MRVCKSCTIIFLKLFIMQAIMAKRIYCKDIIKISLNDKQKSTMLSVKCVFHFVYFVGFFLANESNTKFVTIVALKGIGHLKMNILLTLLSF